MSGKGNAFSKLYSLIAAILASHNQPLWDTLGSWLGHNAIFYNEGMEMIGLRIISRNLNTVKQILEFHIISNLFLSGTTSL